MTRNEICGKKTNVNIIIENLRHEIWGNKNNINKIGGNLKTKWNKATRLTQTKL